MTVTNSWLHLGDLISYHFLLPLFFFLWQLQCLCLLYISKQLNIQPQKSIIESFLMLIFVTHNALVFIKTPSFVWFLCWYQSDTSSFIQITNCYNFLMLMKTLSENLLCNYHIFVYLKLHWILTWKWKLSKILDNAFLKKIFFF